MNDKRIKIIKDMLDTNWTLKQVMDIQKVSAMDLVELGLVELTRIELRNDWIKGYKESFLINFDAVDMSDLGLYKIHHNNSNRSEFFYSDGQEIRYVNPNEVFDTLFAIEREFTINKILGEL